MKTTNFYYVFTELSAKADELFTLMAQFYCFLWSFAILFMSLRFSMLDRTQKYNICFHQFTEILETIAKEKGTLLRTQSLVHLLLTYSLTHLGIPELRNLINVNVFNIFDFNNNDNVDYFEFFLMITLFRSKDCDGIISLEAKEKEAKEYFDIFDKNTDLYISRQEVGL